jgi:tyrosine-protein kinase Etk/Wzc
MATRRIPVFNEEFDVKLFFHIGRRNFLYLMLFFMLAVVGAFLYLRYTYPLFETHAVIQLDVKSEANKYLSALTNQTNPAEEGMAKRVELLRSPVFLQRTFSKLPLNISYFVKGTILNSEMYRSSPYEVTYQVKNPVIYDVPVFIDFNSSHEYRINYRINGSEFEYTFQTGRTANTPHFDLLVQVTNWNKITAEQSPINSNVFFFRINNPEEILTNHIDNLRVHILSEDAKTLRITYSDRNPLKASDIVNTIVEEFRVYDLERKAEGATNILSYIDDQLLLIYGELYLWEMQIDSFRKVNNIDTSYLNDPIDLRVQIQEYERQLLNFENMRYTLKSLESELQDNKELNVYKLAAIIAGSEFQGVISTMLNGIQELLLKKEQLLRDVTPENAQIEAIDFQVDIRRKLLLESIRSIKHNYDEREVNIRKKLNETNGIYFNRSQSYSPLEFKKLERLYSVNEKYYNELVQKRAEYSITKAGLVSENLVLERSRVPKKPVSPQARMIYLVSIAAGLLFGIGLIIIKYLLYNTIVNIGDIKKYTDIPALGLIPKYDKSIPVSQIIVDREPRSLIAEALRSIRTNLQFISNEPGSKIIAITSTVPGEGKTFFALNLAGVIAFSNKKVIIIDLDLRKPKIHTGFGAANKTGMSTILSGKTGVEECIQKSMLPNLDFITAGIVPPNPSELIISARMDEALDQLKSLYDYVIIDNPPIGVVSDGMKSLQVADFPIYVFKSGVSKRFFIEGLERLLNENSIRRISYVLNGVTMGSFGYGNRGFSGSNQRFGYGYGYGYYDEETELQQKTTFLRRVLNTVRFRK